MTEATRSGGCLCGAIRYTAPAIPASVVVCHCRDCQKQAGSAFSIIAVFPRDAVQVDGTPALLMGQGTSGAPVERHFCGACGSPIFSDSPAMQARGIVAIKAGTLDDVADLTPRAHVWASSKQPWMIVAPDVPCIDRE